MGLFDYVRCSGPEFVCSEGHSLEDEEFQTKDLDCSMGQYEISGGRLSGESGGYGDVKRPFLGRINVYCSCQKCPAFVQPKTHNLMDCWVEFEVEVVDDEIRKVTRVSSTTAEWLKTQPEAEYMKGCHGPMTWEEAQALHCAFNEPCDCGYGRPR